MLVLQLLELKALQLALVYGGGITRRSPDLPIGSWQAHVANLQQQPAKLALDRNSFMLKFRRWLDTLVQL